MTSFVAVGVFTVILLLSPQNWFPFLAPFRIAFMAAVFGVASLVWDRWRRRKPLGVTRVMLFCFLMPVWGVLTAPLSYWPGGSIARVIDFMKAVTIFWLLANVVTTTRRLRIFVALLIACTVPLAGTALKNFASGQFLGEQTRVQRIIGYDSGLTQNPNDLALMLNLLIPLGIALFLSAKSTSIRVLCLCVLGLDVIGVFLTFSRAGFLTLTAIGFVYFLKLVRRAGPDRSWAFAMVVLAIFALPFMPASYVDRLSTITSVDSDTTGSSQIRWRDSIAAIQFIIGHPIVGAGMGMDVLALNDIRGAAWYMVHNVYLEYGVDLGLPGLALFLLLFAGAFKAARSSRRRTENIPALRDLFVVAEGLEVSLTAFAVAGFFHPVAYNFYFYYFAGLALGLAVATDAALNGEHSTQNTAGSDVQTAWWLNTATANTARS